MIRARREDVAAASGIGDALRDRRPRGGATARRCPRKNPPCGGFSMNGAPYGIRTRVLALRGPRPRPLDEGSESACAAGWTTGLWPDRRTRLASIWDAL